MSVQLLIIVIYFALTVGIGVWSSKRAKDSAAFHGAEMGVFAIVCASAGEWLGGTATTGVSEYGFLYGLSGAWYTIANGIGVMFLALCFAKLYRSLNTVTVPGIIEKFFGKSARSVSCVLLVIVMLAVGLSQMIAAGKLGQSLLGFDFNVTVIVFAIIFIIYTLAGGMNAVASTNVMHLFVMYFGVILAIVFALSGVGGRENFIAGIREAEAAEAGANYFNMFTIGMPKVSSWIIASLLGACTAQAGIQPVLAAKDIPSAKKACVITAFVVAPFGLCTALLGMIAKVMSRNGTLLDTAGRVVVDAKLALPALMMNLPEIIGGLVLASILAAILSTVSPIILASGTMLTKDLYQRVFCPNAADDRVMRVSRMTTALSGVVCCAGAVALVDSGKVLDIVYSAYSLRGALFVVVLLGIYWKRASEKGACLSMCFTAVIGVLWVVVKMTTGSYPINDTITETYAAVASAFVMTVLFSLVFPKKEMPDPGK
ncbi:MAG: sodium:solute symporter family protein [Oscillospiraceae bacterium]|nr:sodium:solute symporter family protein [Oscillospiraceae bacterium]